jgi:hypothetical protein
VDANAAQKPGGTAPGAEYAEVTFEVWEVRPEAVPQKQQWAFSAGPALFSGTCELDDLNARGSDTGYGGFVAGEYFLTRYLSAELSLTAISEACDVLAIIPRGPHPQPPPQRVRGDLFAPGAALKLYPLQIRDVSRFRFQPHILAGIHAVLFDADPVSLDPAAAIRIGGAFDVLLTKEWSLVSEATYLTTLGNNEADLHGLLARFGLRRRF